MSQNLYLKQVRKIPTTSLFIFDNNNLDKILSHCNFTLKSYHPHVKSLNGDIEIKNHPILSEK